MNIVLLYGGKSGEHEISLLSATAVARNIRAAHNVCFVFVSKEGKWYVQAESLRSALLGGATLAEVGVSVEKNQLVSIVPGGGKESALCTASGALLCDVVFPVLHGTNGEDGTVQGLLELAGVPYVGCGVFSSACTMDKAFAKAVWQQAHIPVVPYRVFTKAHVNDSALYDSLVKEAIASLQFPLFVKPCSAGSSDGASRATNERELSFALMEAFSWDNKVLIEKAIPAREVECSVLGNSVTFDPAKPETHITAYGPGEIVPTHTFYDYDAKYNDPNGAALKIPAEIDDAMREKIIRYAKEAYRAVDGAGLSRVDFFIDRDTGELYVNELNAMPGFTQISMFPKVCAAAGLSFPDLLDRLFLQAEEQFKAKAALCTSR